jgi:hypothetical protein
MENGVRIVFFVVVGGLLIAIDLWFARTFYNVFISRALVIAPIQIVDANGIASTTSIATMLQARLAAVSHDLEMSQRSLLTKHDASRAVAPSQIERAAALLIAPDSISMPTALLQPVNINVAVGGVEVGGIVAWLQRTLTGPRTLTFVIYRDGNKAVITGDIGALTREPNRSLWIEAPSAPNEVVDRLAYALIQSKISKERTTPVGVLDVNDFQTLVQTISGAARLNRRAQSGIVATPAEFEPLYTAIQPLPAKLPQWHELTYLAAELAYQAHRPEAVAHYQRLRDLPEEKSDDAVSTELRNRANERLAELVPQIVAPAGVTEPNQVAFVAAVKQFADQLKLEPLPPIVFAEPPGGIIAMWNEKEERFVVNPREIDRTPGLPEYVALMGPFMSRHFNRCFGGGNTSGDSGFWNTFRTGLARYLISNEGKIDPKKVPYGWQSVGSSEALLLALDKSVSHADVVRLAVAMLEEYDCDWSDKSFAAKVTALNQKHGIVPEAALRQALAASVSQTPIPAQPAAQKKGSTRRRPSSKGGKV